MTVLTKSADRISATEARVHFGEVYRRVTENDEMIIVERNGKPGAVILSIEAYKLLGGSPPAGTWLEAARRSREVFRPFFEEHPDFDIVEVIRDMRDERDQQIQDAVSGR